MATTVACTIGWGVSDGETIDSPSVRWATVARVDVTGGATANAVRGGIVPSGGNPLQVTSIGTPARGVTVKAGTIVIPGNSTSSPQFALTLLANTNLDTATEHATLPRIDLVCARISSPGTSAAFGQIEVITGTANASPTRPAINNSGTDHSLVIGTINVQPATISTVIRSQDVVLAAATDTGFMAGPGGFVQVPTAYGTNATLSGGVALNTGQPFWSVQDNQPGHQLAGGPKLWGLQERYFHFAGTTDVNGFFIVNFMSLINGSLVADPFPNAVVGATVINCGSVAACVFQLAHGSTDNTHASFKMSDMAGTALTTASYEVMGNAWGY